MSSVNVSRGWVAHVFFRSLHKLLVKIFNKYVATMFSFVYMVVWHGLKKNVVWTLLSFAEYKVEKLATFVADTNYYRQNVKTKFSAAAERRIYAACSVPLAVLSLVSNIFLIDVSAVQEIHEKFFAGSSED